MRGYFAIGSEGLSKPGNLGALMRSAHAFGASFVFTVNAHMSDDDSYSDTTVTPAQIPYYPVPTLEDFQLPDGCALVGIELTDDAIELPSFRHPSQAAYLLGPERGSLSPAAVERCDFTVKIPTKFCINVGMAGVVVMYDRIKTLGRFAPRPVRPGGPVEALPDHKFGGPLYWTDDNRPVKE